MTISVWVNPSVAVNSIQRVITSVNQGAYNSSTAVSIAFKQSGNLSIADGSSCSYNDISGVLKIGVWQNITLSINGSIVKEYVNGSQVGPTLSCTPITSFTPNVIAIGSQDGGNNFVFTGSIDDLYIYTQSLSLNQVQQIYAMGAAKHGLTVR
jgi:hypothetical protein